MTNNLVEKKLCVKCKKELQQYVEDWLDISNFLTQTPKFYCQNSKCSRYGLITLVCKIND